jgi:light-regulated signal transduction histidine kinase (bacteriophytochrome)
MKVKRWSVSFAAARDITERKRAEEALEEKAQDLARSNADLEQFAYVASHDLQEPLRMVANFTQLLADRYRDKVGEEGAEFIAYAVDGAKRMQRLIQDLLTYSRVGTRGKSFELADCNELLGEAVANLQIAIQESGAVITHEELPAVMGDPSQLTQVFQNLLGNALKFRGENPPRIHVSAKRQGTRWVFVVRDNGIGIAPEFAERIFVIFQRLHSRGEYPGTGIGLAVCKKIVERHGGKIWLESEPGKGATFHFTIPAG